MRSGQWEKLQHTKAILGDMLTGYNWIIII